MSMPRRILVTGAASGIGAHLARRLLERGDRVCAVDINTEALAALRTHAPETDALMPRRLDVRDAAQWADTIAAMHTQWQGIDVLLNVAGVLKPGYVDEQTPADVDFHVDINVKGVMLGTQAAARPMRAQGHGHIVNVASLAGIAPIPGLSLYSASKFAVRGYTLAVAQELHRHGVNVTVVCPDAVQTPMLDLQVAYEQAALTFSGSAALSVEQIGNAILERALVDAPMEIMLPAGRGWTSKAASAFPGLTRLLLDRLRRRGLREQQRRRGDG